MTPMHELPPDNPSETTAGKSGKIFFVFQGRGISPRWQNSPRACFSLSMAQGQAQSFCLPAAMPSLHGCHTRYLRRVNWNRGKMKGIELRVGVAVQNTGL